MPLFGKEAAEAEEKPGLKRTYAKKKKRSAKDADHEAGESMRKEMSDLKKKGGKC